MKFKRLKHCEQVEQLTKTNEQDAGLDIASNMDCVIPIGGSVVITTGIAVQVPENHYGKVASRSGLKRKYNIEAFHGTVDNTYRGELKIILDNNGTVPFKVNKGDRIAQIIKIPCDTSGAVEVDELDETDRGAGGFGSTGV